MNKKGQDTTGVAKILAWLLAILLFVIIVITLVNRYGPPAGYIKNIPILGGQTTSQQSSNIIGYDVINNQVKYYDGTQWLPVKDSLSIQGATETPSQVLQDFQNYLYNSQRPSGIFSMGQTTKVKIINYINIGITQFANPFPGSYLVVAPVKIQSTSGLLELDFSNYLLQSVQGGFTYVPSTQSNGFGYLHLPTTETYSSLISQAIQWRDGIFKGNSNAKAMELTELNEKFCVEEPTPHQYLVIRLNQPVNMDSDCQV